MAKILIVDDDPHILRLVSLILQRSNHEAITVGDPAQALARIRAEEPDLIILDVMMPALSGHELCQRIRASQHAQIAATPILMVSARAQAIDRQTALAGGADAYLAKPLLPADLIATIDRLLESNPPHPPPAGPVISLFSLRGGVGRTTLAVNLATALRRLSKDETCLLELTTSGGQAVIHLRLHTRSAWNQLPPPSQLDWPTLREHLLTHQSGMRLLAAPREPHAPHAFTPESLNAILTILRRKMRFIIIDLPPYINPTVQAALARTDVMFHIVTPDVISVQAARHAMQQLAQSPTAPGERIYLLNETTPHAQLMPQAIENSLRARLAFHITHDPHQSRALVQGAPLALLPSESPIPTTARRIAAALMHREPSGADTAATPTAHTAGAETTGAAEDIPLDPSTQ